ncbi:MAG: hypothetical protein GX173_10935 [Ruminococcaceae bacterium]|jgi:pyridoxine 5'-phosphate synthase PdxJ|nr:hypothetical protein [Oscillospiraceae bacterium]
MTRVTVTPGICGLQTKLLLTAGEDQMISILIESACPHIQAMQEDLRELDAYTACFARFSDSVVFASADKHCRHLACPVPTAIIKGLEVAAGLALPRSVHIEMEK